MTKHSMERTFALLLALLATQACSESPDKTTEVQPDASPSPTAKTERPVSACTDVQRSNPLKAGEVAEHRQFELPVIRYPFGAARRFWGFGIGLRIDESGRVACYQVGEDVELGGERLAILRTVGAWRYTPFARDEKPVTAFVYEHVAEEELPQAHLPLPDVPLEQVRIALERIGGHGTFEYRVEIRGDGTVFYHGKSGMVAGGEHHYSVPTQEVAQLVDSLRSKDIWSLKSAYRAEVDDAPEYRLSLTLGPHTRTLQDNMGQEAGMPRAVSEFEDEVDRVARTDMWRDVGPDAVEILKAEGFVFSSPAGAGLLGRAVAEGEDEDAILALIELGTPLEEVDNPLRMRPVLESALSRRFGRVAQALIDRGALKTNGRRDREKIEAAFHLALAAGRLELVKMVWDAAGSAHRPKLTFRDSSGGRYAPTKRFVTKQSPVTLTIGTWDPSGGERASIVEWLAAQGCDLHALSARGENLLHSAASSSDRPLVRYLLARGVDPLVVNDLGYLPLTTTVDEEVALMLLQAGADRLAMRDEAIRLRFTAARERIRAVAEHDRWLRVLEWLEAHPPR